MTRAEMIAAMERMKLKIDGFEEVVDALRARVFALEKRNWPKTKAIGRYSRAYDDN